MRRQWMPAEKRCISKPIASQKQNLNVFGITEAEIIPPL